MITIRSARPDDWPDVKWLRLRALAADPGAFGMRLDEAESQSDQEWEEFVSHHDGVHATMPLAWADGELVGMTTGSMNRNSGRPQLFALWVSPERRRDGVGARLVDEVVDWARRRHHDELVLFVAEDNAPAIGLYERCGFVVTDEPVDDEHCWMGAFLMRLDLTTE